MSTLVAIAYPDTATADAANNITPGSPRAFRASVTANF